MHAYAYEEGERHCLTSCLALVEVLEGFFAPFKSKAKWPFHFFFFVECFWENLTFFSSHLLVFLFPGPLGASSGAAGAATAPAACPTAPSEAGAATTATTTTAAEELRRAKEHCHNSSPVSSS